MQNKKTKAQIKKDIRRMHEQVAAITLIVSTLVGIVAISAEARRLVTGLAMHPAFAVVEHNSKECETSRHPVKLDDGLRAPHISGF